VLGKRAWHTRSGYSQRSMPKTAMSRYKTIIGRVVRARTLQGQRVEARVGCQILNRMTSLHQGSDGRGSTSELFLSANWTSTDEFSSST
jgi:hypothetical protein